MYCLYRFDFFEHLKDHTIQAKRAQNNKMAECKFCKKSFKQSSLDHHKFSCERKHTNNCKSKTEMISFTFSTLWQSGFFLISVSGNGRAVGPTTQYDTADKTAFSVQEHAFFKICSTVIYHLHDQVFHCYSRFDV